MKISFVIPVYNEEKGFTEFYEKMLSPELAKLTPSYEVIFVNDGSKDKTLQILQGVAAKDKKVRVICFSRNFGKEIALTAGLREASGDAVITMDADGQQPPKLIHEFIEKWQAGAEVVTGVRGKFEKHGFIAKLGSKFFYKILNALGTKDTLPGSTDYRLMDRVAVDEFNKLTEHGRITRGLVDWMGFDKSYIHYTYGNRLAGKPSYNFKKLFSLAIDSFVSMTTTPLVIFGWFGAFITFSSTILGLFVIIQQFIMGDPLRLNWTGPTLLAIFITFLVGLVLISQAITALYISHIHAETQGRPLYIVDRKNSRNLASGKPL
ncbi:MAG: glycosyltransferase family 2 protein [Candidatus Nomurabacteria bacterium]|jgi:dolichol-phosphate mannosyltransferase|nr:glycosyltransferase family 2 protein [Candidatus Nomurabacteria bacterium]